MIERLEQLFEPWATLVSDSAIVSTLLVTMHLLALLLGGGFAVAIDRMTLRVNLGDDASRARQLRLIRSAHRTVLIALAASVLSGVLIAAADVAVFATSPLFWIKLAVVAALLVNGALLRHTAIQLDEKSGNVQWRKLRFASTLSIILWSGAVIAGVLLRDYA